MIKRLELLWRCKIIRIVCWGLIITALIVGIPCLINYLILQPQQFNIVGDGTTWLSFWVTYIGAIASFAMVLITWWTLKQNKTALKQNDDLLKQNNNQQIEIRRQYERKNLDITIDRFYNFQTCINMLEIMELVEAIIKAQYKNVNKPAKLLIRDFDEKSFAIDLSLSKSPQSETHNLFNKIHNDLAKEYGGLITDIIWYNDLLKDLPKNNIEIKSYVKYHIENFGDICNPNNCIKTIIEAEAKANDYTKIKEFTQVILSNLVTNNNIDENKEALKSIIVDYIAYEQNKINNIR